MLSTGLEYSYSVYLLGLNTPLAHLGVMKHFMESKTPLHC